MQWGHDYHPSLSQYLRLEVLVYFQVRRDKSGIVDGWIRCKKLLKLELSVTSGMIMETKVLSDHGRLIWKQCVEVNLRIEVPIN